MSSILKALKKLEENKNVRRHDLLNIDTDILREVTPRRFSALRGTLLALFLFVCGSGATYLFMKHETVSSSRQLPSGSHTVLSPDRPSPALPVTRPDVVVQTSLPEPKNAATTHKIKPDTKIQSPPPVLQKITKNNVEPNKVLKPAPPSTSPRTSDTPPLLRVTGIAFQPEGSDSVAMVNGVSASQGALIEGVKIDDIQKDRVRFSFKGTTFEVPVGKSNR